MTTDPGRTTWEGPCGTAGCELRIKARRVPAETPAATADPSDVEVSETSSDPYQVIEVEGYDDASRQPPEPARGPEPAAAPDAGGGASGDDPPPASGPAEVPAGDGPAPEQLTDDRGGFGFRGRRRRPDADPVEQDPDEVIPGLF